MGFDTTDGIGLRALLDEVGYRPDFRWAWENYQPVVKALSRRLGLKRLCEIGGGRNPLLSLEEVRALGASYAVNDISAGELALVPDGFATACFDVAGDRAALPTAQSFDLVFSRMVFEHVQDVATRPGATSTICWRRASSPLPSSPPSIRCPFLVNRLVPEWLSGAIVGRLYPHRDRNGLVPQFKAYYDHCVSREAAIRAMLEGSGFADCAVIPFWGHDYYRGLPVLRDVAAQPQRPCATPRCAPVDQPCLCAGAEMTAPSRPKVTRAAGRSGASDRCRSGSPG